MPQTLSSDVKHLIDRANFAHLSTLMADGSPQSVPVWVDRDGERLVICTGQSSLKAKNTQRDPRVAISIVDFNNPYEEVQIRGRVVERRSDSSFKLLDAVSQKYTGKPFPMRNPEESIALIIEAEKVRYMKLPFEHAPRK
jgi:PPOX class probable F420-dependent enzyme